jgi:hypothetical protein
MPSAAPISGVGVVLVVAASLGGTVNERFSTADLRGVFCSGVEGVIGDMLSYSGRKVFTHGRTEAVWYGWIAEDRQRASY